jgi:hypothetical protein
LIGGTTIHSLLGFSIDKNIIINKSKTILDSWSDIQFMIVNEILMVGYMMLNTMHLKLQKMKSSILPFGGFNIMFMGEFLQFPPITDTHHYFQLASNQLLHSQIECKKNHR